jgi:hypothetical protein
MNTLKTQKTVILAKIEVTYGTDAGPLGVNVIQAENVSLTPLASETAEQAIMRPYFGGKEKILYGIHMALEFDVAMTGSGTAKTPVPYGPLLRISRRAEVINTTSGSESVTYNPISGVCESATIHTYIDGQKHAMTGARGSVSLKFDKGLPYWHFKLMGVYAAPASVAAPTPNATAWQKPVPISKENTPISKLFGQDVVLVSLSLDDSSNLKNFNLPNFAEVDSIDRAVSGKAVFYAPDIATFDWFTTAKNTTFGALRLQHDTRVGYTITHDCPNVQILNPNYGDSDGVRTIECDLNVLPVTGNDEWITTFK